MLKELFLIDPEIIFLNHGSFGACPRPVFNTYQMWQRKLEHQPVQFLGVDLDNYLLHARTVLSTFVNCQAKDIVFIPNATHGVNIISRSIHLNPEDEILTTNHEYGACNFAWEYICNKTGAIYKRQPISLPLESAESILDQLWQGVTQNTKIIFISHITSPTSIKMPVDLICQRAKEADILTVIDGAHAPGQITLDLSSIKADFYVGNCHKWMLSPKGVGFLYAHPDVQHLIEPLVVSWGYQSKYATPRESTFIDYLQWTGTKDPSAALSVPAAIDFMRENHWEDVRASCHQLVSYAMEAMGELTRIKPLYPLDSDFYHQMGTIPIPRVKDLLGLKNNLLSKYKIEIPTIDWENRHYLRLSVQGYNSKDDIDQLLRAVHELLPMMVEE